MAIGDKFFDMKQIVNHLLSEGFFALIFNRDASGNISGVKPEVTQKLKVSFLGLSDADEVINMRLMPLLDSGYVKVWHRWMSRPFFKKHQINDFKIKLARLAESAGDNVAVEFLKRLLGLKEDDSDEIKTDFLLKTQIISDKDLKEISQDIAIAIWDAIEELESEIQLIDSVRDAGDEVVEEHKNINDQLENFLKKIKR